MRRTFPLLLIALLAVSSISFITAKSAYAQSIPTPVVPTFTAQQIVYTTYSTPTYTINPYTGAGANSTTEPVVTYNQEIEVTIKNQPFTPYNSSTGTIGLYYAVRFKGHYANDGWQYYPNPPNSNGGERYIASSGSNYTICVYPTWYFLNLDLPYGGQLDFQVQALTGTAYNVNVYGFQTSYNNFNGVASNWTSTQTLSFQPLTSNSTTPNPSSNQTESATPASTPTVPEFPTIAVLVILPLLLSSFAVAIALKCRKVKYG